MINWFIYFLLFLLLGGQGGLGGHGIKCKLQITACFYTKCAGICNGNGQTSRASRGPRGNRGSDGRGEVIV